MYKILFYFFLITMSAGSVAQKNSVLSGTGNRLNEVHRRLSIPCASDISTSIGSNIFVDAIVECNDQSRLFCSVTIKKGATLAIYAQDSLTTNWSNINSGAQILKGTIRLTARGTNGIAVGNGDVLTTTGRVTFPTYSID